MIKKVLSILILATGIIFTAVNGTKAYTIDAPHWAKSTITVYIPSDEKSATMRHAFEKWQTMSDGKLTFRFVQKSPADIDVVFTDKVNGTDGPLGQYNIKIKNGNIVNGEIRIATKKKGNYSKNLIYTTMLHEVGHVLGLSETERKKSSIMSMPVTETQDIMKRDIRDLYYLYKWDYNTRRIDSGKK